MKLIGTATECQGGVFERLGSYSTLHNDTWSLGVILVNLTCGRNPWKQACPSDETFRAYLDNPDFLRSILPISTDCNELLKRIFTLNPMGRISLTELRQAVIAMPRWTMTETELRNATRATREAARVFAPVDPNAPRTHPAACDQQSEIGSECYPESVTNVNTNTSTAYSFASSISFPNWSGISDLHRANQAQRVPVPAQTIAQQQQPPVDVTKALPTPPSTPRRRQSSVFEVPPVEDLCLSSAQVSSSSSTFCDASSQMDTDDCSGSETPVFQTPSTPKAQIGRPSLASRRKKSFTPPSSGSSSSSGSSWGSLPPTPDTPSFLRSVQHHYAPLSDEINSAVQKMDSIVSTTSSKASYRQYYSQYASWASDDEDGNDSIVISPSESLCNLESAFEPISRRQPMIVRCA